MKTAIAVAMVLLVIVATLSGLLVGRTFQSTSTLLLTSTQTLNVTTSTTTTAIVYSTLTKESSPANETLVTYEVLYAGSWNATYDVSSCGYGVTSPGCSLVETATFYGTNSSKVTVVAPAPTYQEQIMTCLTAQKTDGSTSTLTIALPDSDYQNQTSIPYGSTKLCEGQVKLGY